MLKSLFAAVTHDYLLFFSNKGQVYWLKVYAAAGGRAHVEGPRDREPPAAHRRRDDHQSVLRVPEFDDESFDPLRDAPGHGEEDRARGLLATEEGRHPGHRARRRTTRSSAWGWSRPGDTILVGTSKGRAIRFDEAAARNMGRTSRGVRGIKLLDGRPRRRHGRRGPRTPTCSPSCVAGHGKRTPIDDYPVKGRGGQGVINIKHRRPQRRRGRPGAVPRGRRRAVHHRAGHDRAHARRRDQHDGSQRPRACAW